MLKKIGIGTLLILSNISLATANDLGIVSQQTIDYININKYIDNLNNLDKDITNYITTTGDLNLKNYKNKLQNYTKNGYVKINIPQENNIIFKNLGNLSQKEIEFMNNSLNLPAGTKIKQIKDNNINNVQIIYLNDFKFKNFINLINKVKTLKNNYISDKEPSNKNLLWYKPNNYNFDIYFYNNNQWNKIGTFYNDGNIKIDYVFPKIENLNNYTFPEYTQIYVDNGENIKLYQYVNNKFVSLETSVSQYYGTATLEDTLTTLYNKQGKSKVFIKSEDPNLLPLSNNYYVFIKHDNYINGGYWQTEDGKYTLYNSFENITKVLPNMPNNSIVITKDKDYNYKKLKKIKLPNGNYVFAYIAKNMKEVINFLSADPINGKIYVYDLKDNYIFLKDNSYSFKPLNSKYYIGINRKSFKYLNFNYTYLTNQNDCNSNTCYGKAPTYYAGKTLQNLYQFYFINTTKHTINKLSDTVVISNKYDIYKKQYPAILYIGNTYHDLIKNYVYLKVNYHNNIAYKSIKTNKIFNKNQFYNIPVLPDKYNAININLTKSGNNYIVLLSDDYDIFDFSKMSYGYYVNGKNIGTVKKCNNNILWSDNCSNIGYAHIGISDYRKNLPSPKNTSRINLTKYLDNPKYSNNGYKWTKNTRFYQWFFVNGKGINNMVDALSIPVAAGSDQVDDYAYNINIPFITSDNKLWMNWNNYHNVYSHKYCNNNGWYKDNSEKRLWRTGNNRCKISRSSCDYRVTVSGCPTQCRNGTLYSVGYSIWVANTSDSCYTPSGIRRYIPNWNCCGVGDDFGLQCNIRIKCSNKGKETWYKK